MSCPHLHFVMCLFSEKKDPCVLICMSPVTSVTPVTVIGLIKDNIILLSEINFFQAKKQYVYVLIVPSQVSLQNDLIIQRYFN